MQVWFSTVHIYLIPKVCGSMSDQLALLALSPPLAHNSLSFKLIPCFRSSSSQGRLETAWPAGLKSLSRLLLSLGESAWPESGLG